MTAAWGKKAGSKCNSMKYGARSRCFPPRFFSAILQFLRAPFFPAYAVDSPLANDLVRRKCTRRPRLVSDDYECDCDVNRGPAFNHVHDSAAFDAPSMQRRSRLLAHKCAPRACSRRSVLSVRGNFSSQISYRRSKRLSGFANLFRPFGEEKKGEWSRVPRIFEHVFILIF